MQNSNFEEKTYESYMNNELMMGDTEYYPPGQVIEGILGFDVALNPKQDVIWATLRRKPPAGVKLTANFWPRKYANKLKDLNLKFRANLILQYKRPCLVPSRNTKQGNHWRNKGEGEYYRINITKGQHATLINLESQLKRKAVTRYATPLFVTAVELEDYKEKQELIINSKYVSPSKIHHSHKQWTYVRNIVNGYSNPTPEEIGSESFSEITEIFKGLSKKGSLIELLQPLIDHYRIMPPEESKLIKKIYKWLTPLKGLFESAVSDESIKQIYYLFAISDEIARINSTWLIFGSEETTTEPEN